MHEGKVDQVETNRNQGGNMRGNGKRRESLQNKTGSQESKTSRLCDVTDTSGRRSSSKPQSDSGLLNQLSCDTAAPAHLWDHREN